jgi:hypothetical protein
MHLTKAFNISFTIIWLQTEHKKGAETFWEQHHFLKWFAGSMEQWEVIQKTLVIIYFFMDSLGFFSASVVSFFNGLHVLRDELQCAGEYI